MDKTDELVVIGALGVGIAIAYLVYKNMVGERLEFQGVSVEDHIGSRVPFYSRGGHYGAYGTVPTYWEKHRLVYPREACPNLSGLLDGTQMMNKPNFDADQCAWFSEPPSEAVF